MDYSASSSGSFPALGLIPILIIIAFVVFIYASMWKVFVKAGKPGWAALIPIYNGIVVLEIVGKPLWWFLLFFVPCVGWVFGIWTLNLLCKSFGKSEGFTVGLILFPYIFIPILGFGDAQYIGPTAKEAMAANRFGAGDYQKPFDNTTPPPPPPPAAPEA